MELSNNKTIGWIKLHRRIKHSKVFSNPDLLKLFLLCLCKANHSYTYVQLDGLADPVEIHPGQFVTGRYALHRDYYPASSPRNKSPVTVWRWLNKLERWGNLNIKTNNKYTVVEIVNWDFYQNTDASNQKNEQQMNNKRTADEQQMNTDKNDNNEKYKNISPARKNISQMLKNLPPPPFASELFAIENFQEVFTDYWMARKANFQQWPNEVQNIECYRRLLKLKKDGHDVIEVMRQSIRAGNKEFYPLLDKQFNNNQSNSNNKYGHKPTRAALFTRHANNLINRDYED